MKEARSVANALAAFAIFLLVWAFFVPGYARATRGPRFIRVSVDDLGMVEEPDSGPGQGHGRGHGHGRGRDHGKVSFSVPWAFVRGGLNAASTGRVRRELDLKIGDPIEGETLRGIWKELSTAPEGTEVQRTLDDRVAIFSRKGGLVTIHLGPEAEAKPPEEVEEPETDGSEGGETPKAAEKKAEVKPEVKVKVEVQAGPKSSGRGGVVPPMPPMPAVPPIPPVPHLASHAHHGMPGGGEVVIVLPARLIEALAGNDEGLSPLALVDALRTASPGDLIDVTSDDGHLKIWLE